MNREGTIMNHTVTIAAASSNLKGSFDEWISYFLGTGFGAFIKRLMLLGCAIIAVGWVFSAVLKVIGRSSNFLVRTFFPSWIVFVGWLFLALLLSSPMTGGIVLGWADKFVDAITGAAENKL